MKPTQQNDTPQIDEELPPIEEPTITHKEEEQNLIDTLFGRIDTKIHEALEERTRLGAQAIVEEPIEEEHVKQTKMSVGLKMSIAVGIVAIAVLVTRFSAPKEPTQHMGVANAG